MSTSKFTSRFRRRSEEAVKAPEGADKASETPVVTQAAVVPEAAPEATIVASEPVKAESAQASEAVKADTLPEATKIDTAKGEPAKASTESAKPDSVAPKATVSPSRLVEGEKKKVADLTAARVSAQARAAMSRYRVPTAIAASLIVAIGAGYGFGAAQSKPAPQPISAQWLKEAASDLKAAQAQIGQLSAELKSVKGSVEGVKGSVEGIKGEREKSRSDILAKQTQLSERLERAGQENAVRIGRLSEQLDRIEKTQRDAARLAMADKAGEKVEKAERPEKAEKPEKVAAIPLPPVKPADVAHTGSIGEPKSVEPKPAIDPRKTPLEGFVLRDYDEGYALIETRSGRFIDVAVGYNLPGVGKVEAIERRGRQWVVVTAKGYIGER